MRRVHCCPCSILRGNPPLVRLAVLLSLAMTLFAPLQHVDAKRSSDPPIHDVGGTEGPDDSPSIAYHAFLEKFKTRIDHSPTVLSHKEVFDALDVDMNKKVSNHEMKRFREIVPPPAMSRDHFIKKFGKQGKFSTVPLDMIHGAFDELDQDGDGHLGGDHETGLIKQTLEGIHKQFHSGKDKIRTQKTPAGGSDEREL